MCMFDYIDEMVNIIRESDPTARKEHKCCECGRTIKIGEEYHYEFGVLAGDKCTYKTCSGCMNGRNWLYEICHGWVYEAVKEDLEEHFEFWDKSYGSKMQLGRIIVGMRNQWGPIRASDL